MTRAVLALAAVLGLSLLVLGFLGSVHPAFDTIGAFRIHVGLGFVLLLVVGLVTGARIASGLSALGILGAVLGVAPYLIPDAEIDDFNLRGYQQNIRFDNPDVAGLAAAIRASEADFIVLQEVAAANRALLEELSYDYSQQLFCPFSSVGGVAILARYPFWGDTGCESGQGFAWATLALDSERLVTVAAVHLAWPWPHTQQAHVSHLVPMLRELGNLRRGGQKPIPLIVAGDFNMAPWGNSVKRMAAAAQARLASGIRLTFTRPEFFPGLPLDHVMTTIDISADVRMLESTGSDHRALGIRVRVP